MRDVIFTSDTEKIMYDGISENFSIFFWLRR